MIRHVIGMVDPQGVHIKSFKAPTEEERAQDFLWRIRRALPSPGKIGIFDRSHYEDVLIQRVESMASPDEIERRYEAINEFEAELVGSGITVVKCFLNVSKATQRERLLARLDNPDKYYKYNTSDVDTALKYDDYMAAYSIAMTRCNTAAAPWYVIPADRKWYRNWAIAHVLLETLEGLRLGWTGPISTSTPNGRGRGAADRVASRPYRAWSFSSSSPVVWSSSIAMAVRVPGHRQLGQPRLGTDRCAHRERTGLERQPACWR